MIEPIKPGLRPGAVQELVVARPPEAKAEPPDGPGAAAARTAATRQRVPAAKPGFEVHLDGETLRLYSELRDPQTDRLILRLPTGYRPSAPEPARHGATRRDA